MGPYIACVALLLLLVMLVMTSSRRKSKVVVSDVTPPELDESDDKFDLYESVYQFMVKQSRYIQSLG